MSRIEHFAVFAADPTALKNFYVEMLGLKVILDNSSDDPPGYFLADGAGGALEIIGRPPSEPAVNQRFVCHMAFWVDDLAKTKAAIELAGIPFEADTAIANASMQTEFFRDPEGNRCQIVWRNRPLGT
jgi:glyoxylase I family protein